MTNQHTIRVHFIDGSERVVEAKDFHWVGGEGARVAIALVDGREIPVYRRSDPEWGDMWVEQAELPKHNFEYEIDELDETGTHPPDCRCGWCEPERQVSI